MEAKELMIGDWVYVNNIATQVMQVNEDCEIWTHKDPFLPNENVEPIPLTDEMLKANGFDKEWLTYEFYDGYNFFLDGKNGVCVHVGRIWLVHELQHALRLCNLNELADNFKIE